MPTPPVCPPGAGHTGAMRSVVITGAAGGLGAAACALLADHGWRVFAADLPGEALDAVAERSSVVAVPLDVTDPAIQGRVVGAGENRRFEA